MQKSYGSMDMDGYVYVLFGKKLLILLYSNHYQNPHQLKKILAAKSMTYSQLHNLQAKDKRISSQFLTLTKQPPLHQLSCSGCSVNGH